MYKIFCQVETLDNKHYFHIVVYANIARPQTPSIFLLLTLLRPYYVVDLMVGSRWTNPDETLFCRFVTLCTHQKRGVY